MKRFFIALFLTALLSASISATVRYVPSQYPTIQAAVSACQTGDSVMVAAGTYFEHVSITIGIHLIGEDMFTTTIDAGGVDKCILVSNNSQHVGTIKGFTLKNSGTGYTGGTANGAIVLQTYGNGNWLVTWNYIKDNQAIGILSFDGGVISRNIFENNGYAGGGFARGIFASSYSTEEIVNNDFKDNITAIYMHSAVVSVAIKNNIIVSNTIGISSGMNNPVIQYNDVWNNGTNYTGCNPGTGCISVDPLFAGGAPYDYNLTPGSPCIDAGDPNSPPDLDGTICDMGVFFYYQGGGNISVTLTPFNPPIQIPAAGGSFEFNIEVANNGALPVNLDVWTMATLPNGSAYGPIINANVNIAAGSAPNRDRTQVVPAAAPAGNYVYDAYAGSYPNLIIAEDHFNFSKSAVDGGGQMVFGWNNYGEDFGDIEEKLISTSPESFKMLSAYPNPFNPETNLNFVLREAGLADITVYDVNGRQVSKLTEGWRSSGTHEIKFNASNLPGGVYFARLTTGDFTQTKKLLLIK